MASDRIGIVGYDSLHFVVENLERSRAFYTERFDFKEVARAGDDLVARSGQQSIVFGAGEVRVCVSTPLAERSKAARFLRRHPAGVMSLGFRVENLGDTIRFLEARGGTFLADPIEDVDQRGGRYRAVEIATPLGDVAFRFVERSDYRAFAPGFVDSGVGASQDERKPENMFGIQRMDHVTSNGLTMQPIVAWYRDVLGFEPFWEIKFHTQDVA
jgi:4-hydroxyphenylpyruvate dioxygenase